MFTRYVRPHAEHFEPQADIDPETQRRLRGILERIDYTAFASNQQVLGASLRTVDEARLQHLALAAARCRAQWVTAALEVAEDAKPEAAERIARLRIAYEEFAAAYEALRRMIERGYVKLAPSKKGDAAA